MFWTASSIGDFAGVDITGDKEQTIFKTVFSRAVLTYFSCCARHTSFFRWAPTSSLWLDGENRSLSVDELYTQDETIPSASSSPWTACHGRLSDCCCYIHDSVLYMFFPCVRSIFGLRLFLSISNCGLTLFRSPLYCCDDERVNNRQQVSRLVLLRIYTTQQVTSCLHSRMQAQPLSPVREEGWTESGAHELLHAVLVGGGQEKPAPARVQLVELSSKIADVLQAELLWGKKGVCCC